MQNFSRISNSDIYFQRYFSQPDLLVRVPNIFLIQGAIFVVLQLTGCLIMSEYYEVEGIENVLVNEENEVQESEKTISNDVALAEVNSLGVRFD